MISSTFCTICKLFKPLFSLVPKCDFSMFTNKCTVYSYGYIWIVTPTLLNIPPRPLVHPFRLYDFFLFKIIFDDCILLGKRIIDEILKIFVLCKKITITESYKAGREGVSIQMFMYLWPDLGNSSRKFLFSILMVKSRFLSKDGGGSNWHSNAIATYIILNNSKQEGYSGIHYCTSYN